MIAVTNRLNLSTFGKNNFKLTGHYHDYYQKFLFISFTIRRTSFKPKAVLAIIKQTLLAKLTAVDADNEPAEEKHLIAVGDLGKAHKTSSADAQDVVQQQPAFPVHRQC